MTAIRYHGRGDIRLDTVEEPRCGKGDVKMTPSYAGICGSGILYSGKISSFVDTDLTDLHEYISGPILVSKEEYSTSGKDTPVTLGHEFSGIIREVGEDVKDLVAGQRAVVRPTIFDGKCSACRNGCRHCCANIRFIGLSSSGGGMAHHIVAPADHFYPLPDTISLETAALVEPLAVAWHAVNLSPFKSNDTAIVLGGGPIGIGVIQVLKLKGAKRIILAELMENRKNLARELGATHVFDPRESDICQEVSKLTGNAGADIIFDTAGVQVALNNIISACRAHGTIVNVAVWENKPSINVNGLMYREINYMGAALYDEMSFRNVIEALSNGQLIPDKMITAKIKLADAVEKGFKELIDHRDQHCKILIDAQS